MALTNWRLDAFLRRTSPVWPGARPFLYSAWVRRVGTHAGASAIMSLDINDGTSHQRTLGIHGGAPQDVRADERDGTGLSSATATSGVGTGWFHIAGAWVATDLREAWLGAGNRDESTASRNPDAPTHFHVGIAGGSAWAAQSTNAEIEIAECSVWDLDGFDLSGRDGLVVRLGTLLHGQLWPGFLVAQDPGQPWSGRLVANWSLRTLDHINDLSGNGNHLEAVGQPVVVEHPAVVGTVESPDDVAYGVFTF